MSEIRVNSIKNEAGSGAVELTHGATIPSGASLSGGGGLSVTGVVTATSFVGNLTGNVTGNADTADYLNDAANIVTGTISDGVLPDLISSNIHVIAGVSTFATAKANSFVGALTGDVTGTASTATTADSLQGTPNITVGVVTASSLDINGDVDISGSVSIGGTLTYEDVKNVDSVGIVTANVGVDVIAGGINVTAGGINIVTGIITAPTFSGNFVGVTTGPVTGNVTGDVTGNLTGTATTAILANTATYAVNAGVSTTATYTSEWDITANAGNTYYYYNGPGFAGDRPNPDVFVIRGQQYLFRNQMGGHPFEIRTTAGVALTAAQGVTGNNPVSNGEMFWNVYMNAFDEYQYICTAHPAMNGKIYVVNAGVGNSTSVNTSGIITATGGFVGNLTGNIVGDIVGEVNAPSFDTNVSGVVVTGIATASSFVGALTGNVTGNVEGNASGLVDGSYNLNTSGIVTATGGFIGSASTTPVVITHSAGVLTFTVAGIGSTSLALA